MESRLPTAPGGPFPAGCCFYPHTSLIIITMPPAETPERLSIPGWFLWVFTGFASLGIPWAGWVTISLAKIQAHLEDRPEDRSRIIAIERMVYEHVSNPDIHAGLLRRIERLEAQTQTP